MIGTVTRRAIRNTLQMGINEKVPSTTEISLSQVSEHTHELRNAPLPARDHYTDA